MHGWWIVGVLVAAVLALAPRYTRGRHRRRRVALCRARVDASLSELNRELPFFSNGYIQPDSAQSGGVVAPPTFDSAPSGPSAVRCRRRVVLDAPSLSATLSSGWRMR